MWEGEASRSRNSSRRPEELGPVHPDTSQVLSVAGMLGPTEEEMEAHSASAENLNLRSVCALSLRFSALFVFAFPFVLEKQ